MTYDQYIASNPDISVFVSASAGTGKTKVLTDRVLRLLLTGASPEKILCITYTKAAAAEMERRIEAELGHWAIAEDASLRASLEELTGQKPQAKILRRARQLFSHVLDSSERIRIQTIHGFCQSVLTRFPLEAGIAPHFTLIDEHTSQEFLRNARVRLFTQADGQNEAIILLSSLVSEKSLSDLMEKIIGDRRKFIPWFATDESTASLIEHMYKILGTSPNTTTEILLQKHFNYMDKEIEDLHQACIALATGEGVFDKKIHDALCLWLKGSKDYETYLALFITKTGEPRKQLQTKNMDKHYPAVREILLAEQQRTLRFVDELQSLKIAEVTKQVMMLARLFLTIYQHQKTIHGYMDYDDLILHTVGLLYEKGMAAWVLYKLDGGIDHLLVDEAQDTSPEQWKLVDILASEFFAGDGARSARRTLFIVGDEKQSIFSFQGADPHAFDAMQQRLVKYSDTFKRVRLALSFRSTEPVLQAVDKVFAQENARDGLVFSEKDISHDVHRKGMAGRVELWPLIEAPEPESTLPWSIAEKQNYSPKPETLCANAIADTIAEWLRNKRQLTAHGRAITPGDIIILVQRRGGFSNAMLRALKKRNIPVAGADRLVLAEHIAVQDCLALADFLLLPQDNLSLAVLLKSPFIGLTEEDLFDLAYNRGTESLWQQVKTNKKYSAAYSFLSELLAKTDYLLPYELFAYALETLAGRKKLAARLGPEIDDPLNEFLSLALQYERLHSPSLQGFIHWLRSGNTEIKRDMGKSRDEVRIMTVHGAKGLQAPIVFLPDTVRMPRYDTGLLWTREEKPVPLWSPFSEYDDKHYRALKEIERLDTEREYRRLLYVAMTRAEDELYICGWKGNDPVLSKCWYELIRQGLEGSDAGQSVGGKWVIELQQTVPAKTSPAAAEHSPLPLPAWSMKQAANEPLLSKPLTPSHMESVGDIVVPLKDALARERGRLIHKLLQYLPDVAPQNRAAITDRFITCYGTQFSISERDSIQQEVLGILQHPDFAAVFSADSVAEVPISGIVTDNTGKQIVIAGQIDRLAITENNVYIIDYKTNRTAPKDASGIPAAYVSQMNAYRQLIASLYPHKEIHCALLWTSAPKLMILPNALFESLAA